MLQVWSMGKLAQYLEAQAASTPWRAIEEQMQSIMKHTYLSAKGQLDSRFG